MSTLKQVPFLKHQLPELRRIPGSERSSFTNVSGHLLLGKYESEGRSLMVSLDPINRFTKTVKSED